MWLTVFYDKSPLHIQADTIGDCLQSLSSEVFAAEGVFFCDLSHHTLYWELQKIWEDKKLPPKLDESLKQLHDRLGLRFRLSTQIPWQGGPCPNQNIELWDAQDLHNYYHRCPLSFVMEDTTMLEFFIDMGFESVAQWMEFLWSPQNYEQALLLWGKNLEILVRQLRGQETPAMKRYASPLELYEKIYVREGLDLFQSLSQRIELWEERLHARKMQLKGFRLCIRSEAHKNLEICEVPLSRPTRDANFLKKLLIEKIIELCGKSALTDENSFADHIDWIELKSLGLEHEVEKQLSLFEFEKDISMENWNAMLARLSMQNTRKLQSKIESVEAQDSWRPEQSFRWVSWTPDSQKFRSLENHFSRPILLLKKPEACALERARKIANENEFWNWLEEEKALPTLEHIEEASHKRLYARVQNTWVFWDENQKRVFAHGWF